MQPLPNMLFALFFTLFVGFGNAQTSYVMTFKKGFTTSVYDQANEAILKQGCVITHRSQIGNDYRMIAFDCPPEMTVLSKSENEPSDFLPQSVNEFAIVEKDQEVNIFNP